MIITLSEFQPTPHFTVCPNTEHPFFRYFNSSSPRYFLTKIPHFLLLSAHRDPPHLFNPGVAVSWMNQDLLLIVCLKQTIRPNQIEIFCFQKLVRHFSFRTPKDTQGNRKRGKPRNGWRRSVIKGAGISWNELRFLAADRQKWKGLIDNLCS